jgi:hypothetical protein
MKYIFPTILFVGALIQVILSSMAEYNGEYTKAIYEMMWAGALYYFFKEEMNDE